MPFDPQTYRRHAPRPAPRDPNARPLSDENKMGLVLLAVAIIAFGAYTLMVVTGIMSAPE